MNKRFVERISRLGSMRRVLARQHVSPDGLLTRYDNMPFEHEENLAFKDNSEEPESIQSRYILDVPHLTR